MHADPAYAKEAFQSGASGYLLKRSAASELVLAIHAVLKDQCYVTPEITKDVLLPLFTESEQSLNVESPLTKRQREVLQLVAEGKSVKDIANSLMDITGVPLELEPDAEIRSEIYDRDT